MKYRIPDKEEQDLVRKYVLERPLTRPDITFKKAAGRIIVIVIISAVISTAVFLILSFSGIQIEKIKIYLCFFTVEFFLLMKRTAILAIHLYQHYAPDEVRRRCLLKPTCSEYAIIVIKKYGALIGIIKIWIRLNYRCRGRIYYIDEP